MLFLISFILPVTSFAADKDTTPKIIISADKSSVNIGDTVTITVEADYTDEVTVNLSSNPTTNTTFSENNFIIGAPASGHTNSEQVNFSSSANGAFVIQASATNDYNTTILSQPIIIKVGNVANAGSLTPTVSKTPVDINESSVITVVVPNKDPGVELYFETNGGSLDKKTCTPINNGFCSCITGSDGSCNVSFSSSTEGLFTIDCLAPAPHTNYVCAPVAVKVAKPAMPAVSTITDYYPLAPLPGVGTCTTDSSGKQTCVVKTGPNCDANGKNCTPGPGFAGYLNALITLFIGICAILAMIMIVMGGIEYMTSELVSSKEHGKETITHAILGLLLALGAYALLNTINPDLLNINLSGLQQVTITIAPGQIAGDSGNPSTFNSTDLSGSGVTCTKSGGESSIIPTAISFVGKVTYSLTWPFGWNPTDKTIYSNCSTWVNQVYDCVGLASPGSNADTMFQGALSEKINTKNGLDVATGTINGSYKLQPGDLLGWISGENPSLGPTNQMGHVVMYTGGGGTIEVDGPLGNKNNALQATLSLYGNYNGQNLFKHFIRIKNVGQGINTGNNVNTISTTVTVTYNPKTKKILMSIGDFDGTDTYTYKLYYNGDYSKPIPVKYMGSGNITTANPSVDLSSLYATIKNSTIGWAIWDDGTGIGQGSVIIK